MGAAHAHLRVVAGLVAAPLRDVEVHWVTQGGRAAYSGMVSGWVRGEYAQGDCLVDVAALARAAGVRLHPTPAVALNAGLRSVRLATGETLIADVLSLGIGSVTSGSELPGVAAHSFDAKAILARCETLPRAAGAWAVVGSGLGGIELALCLAPLAKRVVLVSETRAPPAGASPMLQRAVAAVLKERGVRLWRGRANALTERGVLLASGEHLEADAVLWVTGPAPHPLLANSGLALGAAGAVQVNFALQSTSHPAVFAAGDCADLPTPAPKSGVHSVREAPTLGQNLRAALFGGALVSYRPQRRALALLNCGDGTALLSYGRLAARGRWVRAWKHRLDTGFLEALRAAVQRTVP